MLGVYMCFRSESETMDEISLMIKGYGDFILSLKRGSRERVRKMTPSSRLRFSVPMASLELE